MFIVIYEILCVCEYVCALDANHPKNQASANKATRCNMNSNYNSGSDGDGGSDMSKKAKNNK